MKVGTENFGSSSRLITGHPSKPPRAQERSVSPRVSPRLQFISDHHGPRPMTDCEVRAYLFSSKASWPISSLHFTSSFCFFFFSPKVSLPSKKALKTCKSKVRITRYLGLTLSFQILYSILPVQEQGLKIGVNNTKCNGRIFNYSEYTKYIVPRAYQTRE